jgi:hypothetical protein
MSDSNWRDILKAQQEDLRALQNAITSNEDDLDDDIERVLSRPLAPTWTSKLKQPTVLEFDYNKINNLANDVASDDDAEKTNVKYNAKTSSNFPPPPAGNSEARRKSVNEATGSPSRPVSGRLSTINPADNVDDELLAGGGSVATPKAPEASARFQKAKLTVLTKQLEESMEMRRKLNEQVDNLTHQLKNDREENKQLKKR